MLNEKTLSYDKENVDYSNTPKECGFCARYIAALARCCDAAHEQHHPCHRLQGVGMPAIKFVPEDKYVGGKCSPAAA